MGQEDLKVQSFRSICAPSGCLSITLQHDDIFASPLPFPALGSAPMLFISPPDRIPFRFF